MIKFKNNSVILINFNWYKFFNKKTHLETKLSMKFIALIIINFISISLYSSSCNYTICDCDKVFKHWGEEGTNGTGGYSVDPTTDPNLWELSFGSSAPSIFFDVTTKYLYFTEIESGCTTRYNCNMSAQAVFYEIMKKAFMVNPLETYTPTTTFGNNILGTDNADYDAGTKITTIKFDDHFVLEYDANTDVLIDKDNPGKRHTNSQNCEFTDYLPGEDIIPYGGSGSGYDPDNLIRTRHDKTGPSGTNGIDEADGGAPDNMYEDAAAGRMLQDDKDITNKAFNDKLIADVRIANQQLSIQLKEAHQNKEWLTCSLFSIDGKLIETQKLEDNKTQFKHYAPGVYLLTFYGNGKTYTQKIWIQ
jgi:hypothetical protein